MDFRVTSQVTYDLAVAYARQHSDLLAHLQQEAATGNRLLRPSDDPLATVQLLSNQAQNLRLDTYQSNVQAAQATLNGSNSALLEAGNIFTQAQQVASEGSNSTNDPTSFEAL